MSRLSRTVLALIIPTALAAVLLAKQPQPEKPVVVDTFAAATKKVGPAVFMIGSSKGGHGTGFLISKEHRLIATNAHVADIMHPSGKLFAIRNDTATMYKVEKAYYHPGLKRHKDGPGKASVVSVNPADGEVDVYSPDVAVLQLAAGGPDLPAAIPLADTKTLDDLLARPIGILGFPGHDSKWPDAGDVVSATFHDGSISRITGFDRQPAEGPAGRKLVQYTIQNFGGYSGSPVYLADGRVVAVNHMVRAAKIEKLDITKSIAYGIRADLVLEVLAHHKLPELKAVTANEPGTIAPAPVPMAADPVSVTQLRKACPGLVCSYFYFEGCHVIVQDSNRLSEMVLRHIGQCDLVTNISYSPQSIRIVPLYAGATDNGVSHLASMSRIKHLELPGGTVTDRGMRFLRGLTTIEELDLSGNPEITDSGVAALSGLKNLRVLKLAGTKVTGAFLEQLAECKNLEHLDLTGTSFEDVHAAHLARFQRLQLLKLGKTKVTDAAMEHIRGIGGLISLDLSRTAVTDDGLKRLGDRKLPTVLDHLSVAHTKVTGTGLAGWQDRAGKANSYYESEIDCTACPISDAGLAEIVRIFPNTKTLKLGDRVTPKGMELLEKLTILEHFTISGDGVTDDHLAAVGDLVKLTRLYLGPCPKVTDVGIKELRFLKQLQFLEIDGVPMSDAGLEHLAGATKLFKLALTRTHVTDAGLKHLRGCEGLFWLTLDDSKSVADPGLIHLANLKLSSISLRNTAVSAKGVAAAQLKSILWLNLNGCSSVRDDGLAELTNTRYSLFLDLGRTAVTDAGLLKLQSNDPYKGLNVLELGLKGCPNITDDGLKKYLALPRCLPGRNYAIDVGQTAVTAKCCKDLQKEFEDVVIVR